MVKGFSGAFAAAKTTISAGYRKVRQEPCCCSSTASAEHSGRYANLIGHLVPRGYAVYGMDHVGHGKSGGADKLVDPAGARMLHDLVGFTDKTLKVYQGLYHEVYNEPEHEQVLRDMDYWLEAHLASTAYLAPPSTPQGGTEKSPPKGGEGGGRWDVNISPCPSCPSLPRC